MGTELTRDDISWHEGINPPMADGSQCYKAWGYHDATSWLTNEQKERWKRIDEIIKRGKDTPPKLNQNKVI